jgi:hypothetical protein
MIASRHLFRISGQVPIIWIGGSLIWKFPEVLSRVQKDGGADHLASAEVACSVAGHLQTDWHIDHRTLVWH